MTFSIVCPLGQYILTPTKMLDKRHVYISHAYIVSNKCQSQKRAFYEENLAQQLYWKHTVILYGTLLFGY